MTNKCPDKVAQVPLSENEDLVEGLGTNSLYEPFLVRSPVRTVRRDRHTSHALDFRAVRRAASEQSAGGSAAITARVVWRALKVLWTRASTSSTSKRRRSAERHAGRQNSAPVGFDKGNARVPAMSGPELADEQLRVYREQRVTLAPALDRKKTGLEQVALNCVPLNGLRHCRKAGQAAGTSETGAR